MEDAYLTALAELDAICDPRPYDPWPNHRVASGASLAVTLAAYRAIGGLPPVRLGEDAALVRTLEEGGFEVRHSLAALVTTSCRFDGRAKGGAADTMRLRHAEPETSCSDDIEPALRALRRFAWKGTAAAPACRVRPVVLLGMGGEARPCARPTPRSCAALLSIGRLPRCGARSKRRSAALRRLEPLRPSDLPRETARAARIIACAAGALWLARREMVEPIGLSAHRRGEPAIA